MQRGADVRRIVGEYADAKNRHDVEAALRRCHPDCFYESVGIPGRVEGHSALRDFYAQLFELLPDYRGDFDGVTVDGGTALAWGRMTGTAPGGRQVDVPVVFRCSVEDGLIVSDTGYFDAASFYEQAGLAAGSPADANAAAWVAGFAERWVNPVPEAFADLLHPHTRNLYPGMDEAQDRDGVVEWFRTTLALVPDLTLEVLRWAATGDGVMIEWSATATIGGEARSWQGADRFTLDGSRAVEGRAYFDTAPLQAALGAAV